LKYPLTLYRLWCGKKRYSHWVTDRDSLFDLAARKGIAYSDRNGDIGLGPLTWIEVGDRARPKARTVPRPR